MGVKKKTRIQTFLGPKITSLNFAPICLILIFSRPAGFNPSYNFHTQNSVKDLHSFSKEDHVIKTETHFFQNTAHPYRLSVRSGFLGSTQRTFRVFHISGYNWIKTCWSLVEIRKKATKPGKKFLSLAESLNVTEKNFSLKLKWQKVFLRQAIKS